MIEDAPKEVSRALVPNEEATPALLEAATTPELIKDALKMTRELAQKELELAIAEAKADLRSETAMAKGLGVAGVAAISGLNMLLVMVIFALSAAIKGWIAALIVAAVVLAIAAFAGLYGWGKRVKTPLEKTQMTMKENVKWAKERLA